MLVTYEFAARIVQHFLKFSSFAELFLLAQSQRMFVNKENIYFCWQLLDFSIAARLNFDILFQFIENRPSVKLKNK